jgi:hypothetical protein
VKAQEAGAGFELVLLDESTMERDFGWVFFYDSKSHAETGEIGYAVAGNAPIVVTRAEGTDRARRCTGRRRGQSCGAGVLDPRPDQRWRVDGKGRSIVLLHYVFLILTFDASVLHYVLSSLMRGVSGDDPEGGARIGVPRPRLVTVVSEGSGPRPPGTTTWLRGARCTDPQEMAEMEARPQAQNRHGWSAERRASRSQGDEGFF